MTVKPDFLQLMQKGPWPNRCNCLGIWLEFMKNFIPLFATDNEALRIYLKNYAQWIFTFCPFSASFGIYFHSFWYNLLQKIDHRHDINKSWTGINRVNGGCVDHMAATRVHFSAILLNCELLKAVSKTRSYFRWKFIKQNNLQWSILYLLYSPKILQAILLSAWC